MLLRTMALTSAETWNGNDDFAQCIVTAVESGFEVFESVGERFLVFAGLRLDGDAKRVFFFVVAEAAPRRGIFREDDRPLIGGGDHVEAVGAGGERLAFNAHVVGEGDDSVFVGTGAPDLAVRDHFAEELPAA